MNIKKLFFGNLLLVLTFFVASPLQVFAQDWGDCVDSETGIASLACLPIVFSNIVNAALMFVGTVAVFLFVWAGLTFVRSGGDPKQVQHARQIITYAIIGLVLVLSSFAIIYLISYLTGANCIETMGFSSCQ